MRSLDAEWITPCILFFKSKYTIYISDEIISIIYDKWQVTRKKSE